MKNWAGNHTYRATRLERPATLDALRALLARERSVRVLGSRHSFNAIADADVLVSLERLPPDVVVEEDRVSFNAGLTYGALAQHLEGLALHNLASLPHISVAGAVATGTHGSGTGNLATAVAALELVTSEGESVRAARGDPDFDGMVVGLGALGAVTRLTLDVEPAYAVAQRVFEGLSWDALFEHLDAILGAAYSVSVFTRWRDTVDQVWLKARGEPPDTFYDARPATVERHPILGVDPVHCTAQQSVPGPWWDRLPHFRMGFTPSRGEEVQSEYLLPREHAVPALRALRTLDIRSLLVSEIRSVAADRLWMSPQYGRDTIAIHFTWEPVDVTPVLREVEAALAPFDPRPHWGKLYAAPGRYEREADFSALAERLDPRGAFR